MQELKNMTIFVDGQTVGYQFNKRSMGSRTFKNRTVKVSEDGTATAYIPFLQREIRVRRIYESHYWESVS